MAFSVSTDFIGRGLGFVVYHGSWSGSGVSEFCGNQCSFESTIGDTASQLIYGTSGTYNSGSISCPKDTTITWRAAVYAQCLDQLKHGNYSNDKTYADTATFPTGLTPGTPTTTTCPISGSVIPNTVESVGTVTAEYRIQGTSTWIVGPTVATGISGLGSQALAGTLTALTPATIYEARYHINRNTTNSQDAYSAIGTFTTQASTPVVIGPPVMDLNLDMPTPVLVINTIPLAPILALVMDIRFEMLVPTVGSATTRVITRVVLIGGAVERNFRMS